MNNMLEYMTGGQCYECGGKVRYDDGGYTFQQDPSAIAPIGQMQKPMRAPSTLDASAKQLMKFILDQFNKGTSERILKKTLMDSGVKREQAEQLLEIAKQEYMKLAKEGDYVNENSQQEALQSQQQMALQQQMGMMNNQDPMGMNQAGPQTGQDQSQIAMSQGADQQQMTDQEMAGQARFGGSMKKLRRYGAGGDSCPNGYEYNEMTGQCMPTAVTTNTTAQGPGGMKIFGGNEVSGPGGAKTGIDQYNQNVVAAAQAADARNNAQANFYGAQLANYDANRVARKDASQQAIGALYSGIRNDQSSNPQNNFFQSFKNVTNPVGTNYQPQTNQGYTQDQGTIPMSRYGGLNKFVNSGLKQYGAGGTEDGCPIGYYKGPDGDCLKIFGSNQAKQEYQSQVVDFYNQAGAPSAGANKGAMMSFEEWQKTAEGKAQDDMYNEMITSPAAYQNYVNQYSTTNAGKTGADPQLSYEQWKNSVMPNSTSAPNSTGTMPTDPRLTNSPYIVMSDKNKIANIDSNWATRAMAVSNSFADPRFAPIAGGFGPGLQFLMGAAAAAGGLGLGIAKGMAGNESRVYDDKGNVWFYNNKRDERRALNQNQPTASGNQGVVQPTTSNAPVAGSNTAPTQEQVQQYLNSQLRLPGQQPLIPTTQPVAPISTDPPADNNSLMTNNPFPPQEYPTVFSSTPDQVAPKESSPLQSDDPNAPNYNPYVPKTIKEDGGEWNPFVDNRRKLRITMPIYDGGGALDTETTPYSQQEWASKTGRPFPLNRNDWDAYNNYVANFNNPATAGTPSTNGVINTTDNTNNALSANPNANMTDTKEYTTQTGDPLGFQVASNTLQGFNMMEDSTAQSSERKKAKALRKLQKQAGNTMMANNAINVQNSYGTWNLNAGPGANQYVADLGHTQEWGTRIGKFGGTKNYRKGGTYMISPQELQAIIQMGGEVEFLD